MARRTHSRVAGFSAEVGEGGGAEVAHAALHAPNEIREHVVHGAADFLQRLDAFGGDLAGGVGLTVAIAGGAAGFHRGKRAHAAVLFVDLAGDFHDFARRFAATGEQAAADDSVGQREGFHEVTALGDAAVSEKIARMVAMRGATENADDMIKSLTRLYNRARQSQINRELAETIGALATAAVSKRRSGVARDAA